MKIFAAAAVATALTVYIAAPASMSAAAADPTPASLSNAPAQGGEKYLCDQRTSVVGELSQSFKEKPVAVGLQGNGTLLEVFASKDTGSWSILLTLPSGVSCLTLVGDSFEMLPQRLDGPGA